MRTLRLELELDGTTVHPMHDFVCRREDFSRSRLLHWNAGTPDGTNSMIFHVVGDAPDAYAAALEEVDSVVDYHLTSKDDGSFYLFVRQTPRDADRRLMSAYRGKSLVVVPPVVYRGDRSMLLTLVGSAEAVQAAVSDTPDDVGVDVLQVGQYDAGAVDSTFRLTPRQREAVGVAVDVGYYGATREGSVADVADALDCSKTTAAEHLRKAEAEIMSRAVERRF